MELILSFPLSFPAFQDLDFSLRRRFRMYFVNRPTQDSSFIS
jgi:hypothetical protein